MATEVGAISGAVPLAAAAHIFQTFRGYREVCVQLFCLLEIRNRLRTFLLQLKRLSQTHKSVSGFCVKRQCFLELQDCRTRLIRCQVGASERNVRWDVRWIQIYCFLKRLDCHFRIVQMVGIDKPELIMIKENVRREFDGAVPFADTLVFASRQRRNPSCDAMRFRVEVVQFEGSVDCALSVFIASCAQVCLGKKCLRSRVFAIQPDGFFAGGNGIVVLSRPGVSTG